MNVILRTNMVKKKLIYCTIWSIGLFVATFYCLLPQWKNAFCFTDKEVLSVARSHFMPMIMAMALYLLDVVYNISSQKVECSKKSFCLILVIIITFMTIFVFSILINNNIYGWILFVVSWICLTILKFITTDDGTAIPYPISDN